MVWIIALLCLGLVGAAGYHQGPVRAAFSFFGLLFGTFLAGPLSPLTQRLLPLLGLHHPAWSIFVPQVVAFLVVLAIFKIAGQVVHQKIAVYFKYKVDDQTLYRWQRVYSRLGLCVGLLNGAVYFILLSLLIYSAGYFTTEAGAGEGDPAGVRFLTTTRAGLHDANLDRVLASYDMVPPKVYQAADIGALIVHNPPLLSRLGHYPPCLQLVQQQQFKDLSNDKELQQMITNQARVIAIVNYPAIHNMLTNGVVVGQLSGFLGPDLDDLQTFLTTGQSPKYDPEAILGVWDIDRPATLAQLRKKNPKITLKELGQKEQDLIPQIEGLIVTITPDHQVIVTRPKPGTSEGAVVAAGTWKKDQDDPDAYVVNLPGSLPEDSLVKFDQGVRLYLEKFGCHLAFDKEM
jgi:hypothetical protein